MSRISDDARRRVRAIREEALARHAERERSAMTMLRDEIADVKAMIGQQQEQLTTLTSVVAALAASLAPAPEVTPGRSVPRPLHGRKREVLERIRDLRSENLSFSEILAVFELEQVPTLSGQGRWSKGTLWNLWRNHSHQLNESEPS